MSSEWRPRQYKRRKSTRDTSQERIMSDNFLTKDGRKREEKKSSGEKKAVEQILIKSCFRFYYNCLLPFVANIPRR